MEIGKLQINVPCPEQVNHYPAQHGLHFRTELRATACEDKLGGERVLHFGTTACVNRNWTTSTVRSL